MSKQLPERPDLGQLKKQAKDLLDEIRAGSKDALARVSAAGANAETAAAIFALHDAQQTLAREYGFPSWARLKLHVETRTIETAEKRLIEAALEGGQEAVDTILRERPTLGTRSIFVAAALGNEVAICREAGQTPALVHMKGGPRDWPPLLYLCFGRCGGSDEERARAAAALLDRGADANASWLHVDWPESPLPALYGATSVNNYPALARVLLQAGANPNDGESRYHAAEHHHVACLEVLHEFRADFSGADNTWGSTPLCFLLGYADATPAVAAGIRWLLEHGANPNVRSLAATLDQTALHTALAHGWDEDTVRLLLQHGADPALKRADGRTAFALAIRSGREDVIALLRGQGVAEAIAPEDEFIGCCMQADADGAQKILARHPALLRGLTPQDRKLPLLVAKKGLADTLRLLGQFGFDLAVEGETGEQPLHWASWHGHLAAVRTLVAAGVPLSVGDKRFCAPPLGWCAHGSENRENPAGDYGAVAETLLTAGAQMVEADGSPEVMAVLKRWRQSTVPPRRVDRG